MAVSRLKSVNYAFGIAIYTGKDTKLMKNINRTRLKKSDIDKILLYIKSHPYFSILYPFFKYLIRKKELRRR